MKVNGRDWVLDHALSQRWPLYTRGNVGEVFPDVAHPLTWSLLGMEFENAWRSAFRKFGVVAADDFDGDRVILGISGGYCYLNMSYLRMLGVRTPGSTVKLVDKSLLGEANAPKYMTRASDRNFLCSLKLMFRNERILRTRRVREVEAMRRVSADWVARYPADGGSNAELIAYVEAFRGVFNTLFDYHVFVTFSATNAAGAVALLCALKVKDPGLTLDLLSGVEGVESAEPARMLWKLGRMVAVSPALTRLFDGGVDESTWPTLQALPDAQAFNALFREFLERYGYRGPNEWEFAAPSWRMKPHVPLRAVDRMRLSRDDEAPGSDFQAQLRNAEQATRYARRKLWGLDNLKLRKALPAAKTWQIAREASKSSVIRALDQTRRAINELVRRVAEKRGGDANSHFMLTWPEFLDHFAGRQDHCTLMAERARDHAYMAERIPPFLFQGEPPPVETWQKRAGGEETRGRKGDILEGIGGSPGRVTGRARIVLDTENPDVLEPGDILIAPITDPSWTPLFLAAAGVVVDVGAVMSHSVIVSRDLGIPCVVSVTDATRIIPDGALIEIDGDVGTVTILDSVGLQQPEPAGAVEVAELR
jgi:pyruvate,water dikinase